MTRAPDPREAEELLALRPGVYSGQVGGRLHLLTRRSAEPIGPASPDLRAALRRLAGPPVTRERLRDGGADAADELLVRLRDGGWLAVTVAFQDQPRYTLTPYRRPTGPRPASAPPGLVLSRFTVIRRDGTDLVMELPHGWCDLRLHDPALLAVLGDLRAGPASRGLPPAVVECLRRDLAWAGMSVPAPEHEPAELKLRQWAAHELWFHDRSRASRRWPGEPFGGTWWARGVFDPLPAVANGHLGPAVDLPRPDLARLRAADLPLTAVLEDRRSLRAHDDAYPVTLRQLGELLYRCARNRGRGTVAGVEQLSRPYPSGGALYELEIFPVVRLVAGLAAGMYHYDPERHRLARVCGPNQATGRLLRAARRWAGAPAQPQVLLVIAARFGRVMWKYQGMAYALILKHVGVLYQTIYLVAAAMGLAACGLGLGEPDAFAEATGRDPLVEGTVGELMLGSRALGGKEVTG